MTELNHQTLRDALRQLPEYEPPEMVWDSIASAMEADGHLAESMKTLSQYDPPAEIWTKIETALPRTSATPNRPVFRAVLMRRLAAAAAITGLLISAWWLIRPEITRAETLVVTQEILDSQVLAAAQEPEDDAFELLQNLCRESAPVCQQPEFKILKNELDELTNAKNQLREALGPYGDDPDMTARLVRIERERSELLQQMMQMI